MCSVYYNIHCFLSGKCTVHSIVQSNHRPWSIKVLLVNKSVVLSFVHIHRTNILNTVPLSNTVHQHFHTMTHETKILTLHFCPILSERAYILRLFIIVRCFYTIEAKSYHRTDMYFSVVRWWLQMYSITSGQYSNLLVSTGLHIIWNMCVKRSWKLLASWCHI